MRKTTSTTSSARPSSTPTKTNWIGSTQPATPSDDNNQGTGMLQVQIAARCEVGGRNHNEDDLRHGQSGSLWYAVLSDGAGGHKGGAIASDIVVRVTALGLQSATQATPDYLTQLVCEANDTLLQSQDKRSRDRMHATLVALWIDAQREEALWTHVGDSRLYMLRHCRVVHMTQDD